jgi:hypothetical protein
MICGITGLVPTCSGDRGDVVGLVAARASVMSSGGGAELFFELEPILSLCFCASWDFEVLMYS